MTLRRKETTGTASRNDMMIREEKLKAEPEKKNKKQNSESNSGIPIFQEFFGIGALSHIMINNCD